MKALSSYLEFCPGMYEISSQHNNIHTLLTLFTLLGIFLHTISPFQSLRQDS